MMGAHEKIFDHLMEGHYLEGYGGYMDKSSDYEWLKNASTQELLEFHENDHSEYGDEWYPHRTGLSRRCSHRHKSKDIVAIYQEIFREIATGDPSAIDPKISFTAIQGGA